ncbi:sodium:solute symporter [Aliifodinibius sp. S!AR15-10]|uniref:sodium:solute symporter family transporter n=1 Tax=Aliifodinibius sp. S!AR15-10 TaxID=2950437 RepID=UPI0028548B6A|nr:sodium-coupled permease [Aliifodinibius sp. S!AR15-10]MDR8391909.1 sodium:solute symporter [Aliifodinibius sp. S!AR15-10]
MHWIDWVILILFLGYTIWDGSRRGYHSDNIEGFFLANRAMPWWAMGLSVMATQASAITFIGTTGQSYVEDMRFVQIYLAVPFAMIILCTTLVPFFHKLQNFSAYEVLEERFGLSTRLFTSLLFLISRGLGLGMIIAAPSYVLALLLNFPLSPTIIIIGITATLYTMVGGISGVIRTDVKQMAVMAFGLIFSFYWIITSLPPEVGFSDALYLAGNIGKLDALDISFDISEKYNIWTGVIAALFLMLSYFGTDQSQVQRYLTAKSLKDARQSLLLSAYAKVPMQFFILLLGVMLYVFYIFGSAPITFRAVDVQAQQQEEVIAGEMLQQEYQSAHQNRRQAAQQLLETRSPEQAEAFRKADSHLNEVRQSELQRQERVTGSSLNDTNYIFPYFILNQIPVGIIGLIVAGIFAAALSSIDSELNSLSTVFIVDWYKRLDTKDRSEAWYLKSSRIATVCWGLLATLAALALGETRSIIELVNMIGSYFYGSILGVFILLLWVKRANGYGALTGLISGMATVFLFDRIYDNPATGEWILIAPWNQIPGGFEKTIEYLWLNPVGTAVVVVVGIVISSIWKKSG